MASREILFVGTTLFKPWIEATGYDNIDIHADNSSFPVRIVRALWWRLRLPGRSLWYNHRLKSIEHYRVIIVEAWHPDVLRYIERYAAPSARLVFYYWNPIHNHLLPETLPARYERWTFDRDDALKYQIRFVDTFYFRTIVEQSSATHGSYDAFFIGREKGRSSEIATLETLLQRAGLTTCFYVVANRNLFVSKHYQPAIPYREVADYIAGARAVIDITQAHQSGLTLRVLEALFFEKKLITNNRAVIDFDFYRKENIFVIGEDDASRLSLFLQTPIEPVDEKIVERYEFQNWLNAALNN